MLKPSKNRFPYPLNDSFVTISFDIAVNCGKQKNKEQAVSAYLCDGDVIIKSKQVS